MGSMGNWFGWVCLIGNVTCTGAAVWGAAYYGATWLLPIAALSAFMAFIVGYELAGDR